MNIFGNQQQMIGPPSPGGFAGYLGRGITNGARQLGGDMMQSLNSWRPQRKPVMMPDMIPGGMEQYLAANGPSAQGRGMQSNQDIGLGKIGAWRQKVQDASMAGRPLSYFDLQEGNAQAFDDYKRNLGWNNTSELDLAKVMDGRVKARAAKQNEQDRMNGGGGVNFNWRAVANNLQEQDGLGFTRAVEGGGRALFADGNQQSQFLDDAEAEGVQVSGDLRRQANMMRDVWNQQDEISGGDNDSRSWLKTGSVYGPKAYKSMGMSGNNLSDVAYGTDQPYDPRNGANGMERADALGAKDWQWQKFHNGNLSYGGGNYIGDANYGKANRGYDFQGPTQGGPSKGGYAQGTQDPGGNLTRLIEHWTQNGIKGQSLDQLIRMFGGTLPPTAHVPTNGVYGDTWNENQAASDYYRKLVGNGYKPEQSGDMGKYMQRLLADTNSRFTGMQGLRQQTMPVFDVPNGGAVGAPGSLSMGPDVFDQGNYGSTSIQARPMSDYQRMQSPYRNFADGFDNGYFGARTGAYMGNAVPRGGWAVR